MARKRIGRENQMHTLKSWLLELKNNKAINFKTLETASPSDPNWEHINDIITIKQNQFNQSNL